MESLHFYSRKRQYEQLLFASLLIIISLFVKEKKTQEILLEKTLHVKKVYVRNLTSKNKNAQCF
jgi:hypothetical protein